MALQSFPGNPLAYVGPNPLLLQTTPTVATVTMDAANESMIFIGRIITSDGGSHTIDTTGSSSLQWRTSTVTFANAGTTLVVGLAAVLTSAGPPGRPANVADVITFDVSKSLTGGGGGVTANAWQSHTPDTGTKTIANGDLVAFAVQMTARGGTDSVLGSFQQVPSSRHRPTVTGFIGGTYNAQSGVPNVLIVFSDGAYGWFEGGDVFSTISTRTWSSSSSPSEYGQLYQLPFPAKIYGAYGWWGTSSAAADQDIILYSDPLGTPVAEKTASIDPSTISALAGRMFLEMFATPYTLPANTPIGIVFSPTTTTNRNAYYKTLNDANHRVTDIWGTSGYGISRTSGAFADANSSLDHYYVGLIVSAFDDGSGIGISTVTANIAGCRVMMPY